MSLRRQQTRSIRLVRIVRRPILGAVVLACFFLLSMQGLWNVLLAGSVAVVWKQSLVVLCMAIMAAQLMRDELVFAILAISAAALLCLASSASGQGSAKILYNIFFYVSWLPFYAFGARAQAGMRLKACASLLVAASAIGLWTQFETPYLDILKEDDAEIRDLFGYDQRLAFVYGFSTGVMPVLAVFFCLALMAGAGPSLTLALFACLAACVIPTGSLAACLVLCACAAMSVAALAPKARVAALALFVLLGAAVASGRTERIDIQIARIVGNDASSDSNAGRLKLWRYALDVVGRSTYPQLLVGRGIGSTNDDQFGRAAFYHGESSFLQAAIEGGIVGLVLRLLPFGLLLHAALRSTRRAPLLWFLAGEVIACAVAPIAGTFGVQCGVALIAGLAANDRRSTARSPSLASPALASPRRGQVDGSRRDGARGRVAA